MWGMTARQNRRMAESLVMVISCQSASEAAIRPPAHARPALLTIISIAAKTLHGGCNHAIRLARITHICLNPQHFDAEPVANVLGCLGKALGTSGDKNKIHTTFCKLRCDCTTDPSTCSSYNGGLPRDAQVHELLTPSGSCSHQACGSTSAPTQPALRPWACSRGRRREQRRMRLRDLPNPFRSLGSLLEC